jgi:hypothetical protein
MKEKDKTARFATIVEDVGHPEVFDLWQDPNKDQNFQSALQHQRVMTVERKRPGSGTDFGFVGFKKIKNASYLIFPRSLNAYTDSRIIGIKYDLLSSPAAKGAKIKPNRKASPAFKAKPAPERAPSPKQLPLFQVHVRYTAEFEQSESIEAANAAAARKIALEHSGSITPDFASARVRRQVVKLDKIRG